MDALYRYERATLYIHKKNIAWKVYTITSILCRVFCKKNTANSALLFQYSRIFHKRTRVLFPRNASKTLAFLHSFWYTGKQERHSRHNEKHAHTTTSARKATDGGLPAEDAQAPRDKQKERGEEERGAIM